jgi:hypothetical protein
MLSKLLFMATGHDFHMVYPTLLIFPYLLRGNLQDEPAIDYHYAGTPLSAPWLSSSEILQVD